MWEISNINIYKYGVNLIFNIIFRVVHYNDNSSSRKYLPIYTPQNGSNINVDLIPKLYHNNILPTNFRHRINTLVANSLEVLFNKTLNNCLR